MPKARRTTLCVLTPTCFCKKIKYRCYATTCCQLDTPLSLEVEAHSPCGSQVWLSFFRDPCTGLWVQDGLYKVILTLEVVEEVFQECFCLVVNQWIWHVAGSGSVEESGPWSPVYHIGDTGYTSFFLHNDCCTVHTSVLPRVPLYPPL